MKIRWTLIAVGFVVLVLAGARVAGAAGTLSYNRAMVLILRHGAKQKVSISGFRQCSESSMIRISEATKSRKQTQDDGLFLGVAQWVTGDCQAALKTWRGVSIRSETKSQRKFETESALAVAYAERHDWMESLAHFRETGNANFSKEVGNKAVRVNDVEQAVHWYELSFQTAMNSDSAQRLVNVLAQLGQTAETVRVWHELKTNSRPGSLARVVATLNEAKLEDDCQTVVEAARQALARDDLVIPSLMSVGEALRHCKNYSEAKQAYLRVTELAPEDDYAWAHVGIAAYEEEDRDSAYRYLTRSLEVRPNVLAHEYLSLLAERDGNIELAVVHLLDALKLEERANLYVRLGDLYLQGNKVQEARQAWLRSLALQLENNPAMQRLESTASQ